MEQVSAPLLFPWKRAVTPQEGVERGKQQVPLLALPRQSPGKDGNNAPPNQGFGGGCLFGAKQCGLLSVIQTKMPPPAGLQCFVLKALGESLLYMLPGGYSAAHSVAWGRQIRRNSSAPHSLLTWVGHSWNSKAPHACPQRLFIAPLGAPRCGVQRPVLTSVRLPSVHRLGARGWLGPSLRFIAQGGIPTSSGVQRRKE